MDDVYVYEWGDVSAVNVLCSFVGVLFCISLSLAMLYIMRGKELKIRERVVVYPVASIFVIFAFSSYWSESVLTVKELDNLFERCRLNGCTRTLVGEASVRQRTPFSYYLIVGDESFLIRMLDMNYKRLRIELFSISEGEEYQVNYVLDSNNQFEIKSIKKYDSQTNSMKLIRHPPQNHNM